MIQCLRLQFVELRCSKGLEFLAVTLNIYEYKQITVKKYGYRYEIGFSS